MHLQYIVFTAGNTGQQTVLVGTLTYALEIHREKHENAQRWKSSWKNNAVSYRDARARAGFLVEHSARFCAVCEKKNNGGPLAWTASKHWSTAPRRGLQNAGQGLVIGPSGALATLTNELVHRLVKHEAYWKHGYSYYFVDRTSCLEKFLYKKLFVSHIKNFKIQKVF